MAFRTLSVSVSCARKCRAVPFSVFLVPRNLGPALQRAALAALTREIGGKDNGRTGCIRYHRISFLSRCLSFGTSHVHILYAQYESLCSYRYRTWWEFWSMEQFIVPDRLTFLHSGATGDRCMRAAFR